MGLVIDTCIFIAIERDKHTHPVDFSQWEKFGEAYISAVTVSELLIGVHSADTKARQIKRAAFVEAIIDRIPALDFTSEIARIHAQIVAQLSKKGQLIGAHDLIIGATALAQGYALLTKNQKEFKRIPGLEVLSF
jgi:tRNA(fMet)-specific endonuclease VapC